MSFAIEKYFLSRKKAFTLTTYCLFSHSKGYGPKGGKMQRMLSESDTMSGPKKPMSASAQGQDEKSSRIKQIAIWNQEQENQESRQVHTFTLTS